MSDYGDLTYALSGMARRRNPYDEQRKYAYSMMQQGSDTSPILSPWQGVSRLAQAIAGGVGGYLADKGEAEADKKRSDALAAAMAEPDPQKRIGLLASYDPEAGARAAGALAVEQAKLQQQQANTGQLADRYMPASPPQTAMPTPLPGGPVAPGGFANNAGNIRVTPAAWQGEGPPQNGFKTFDTPQAGANAMATNLNAYVQANPTLTVAQAIQKWAPPNENNTNAYIRNLAEATGINPGMPLAEVMKDPAVAATLMDGIARIEKGGLPQGFTADTFMQAAGASPPGMPQGGGNQPPMQGQPPAPSPQGINGPAVIAPPQIPQKLTVQTAPPEIMAPFVQKLRQGFYGYGPDAAMKMEAHAQQEFDRIYEGQKLEYSQKLGDYQANRNQAIQQPNQTFTNEGKMRDDFRSEPVVKSYREVVPIMESVKDAVNRPSRAADLNLVYGLAKMMDPNSVVREGEMVMVQNTGTIGDWLSGQIGRLNGGQMLQPDTRQKIIQEMQSRFRGLQESHDTIADVYRGIAQRSGLNADNIVIPIRKAKPTEAPGQTTAPKVYDINGKPL